eukprot:TRINITY_DN7156_c0_g1_i5.p1 TRINITY_DN7156_c0_g1~~TRINITY_DN7156_c0_g1_i5.p1  ORF type:complete len:319 (-),score=31.08 TRINITY_DN7156_c0_g1_i5:70-1026(-)
MYAWVVRAGHIIAPGVGVLSSTYELDWTLPFNQYTIPPFIMVCVFGLLFLIQTVHYVCTRAENHLETYQLYRMRGSESMSGSGNARHSTWFLNSPTVLSKDAMILLFVYFTLVFVYWSFLAAVVPFVQDNYHFTLQQAYIYFLYIGIIFAGSFGFYQVIKSRLSQLQLVMLCLLVACLGLVFVFEVSDSGIAEWQLIVATTLLVSGFCIGAILLPLLYASLIGVKMENLGLQSSWFFAAVSLGMAVAPLWGATAYNSFSLNVLCVVSILLLLICIIVILLRPPHTNQSSGPSNPSSSNQPGVFNQLKQPFLSSNESMI